MTKLDIQYTLSPKWIIRKEEKIFPYYMAYNIIEDKQYKLSESLFSLLLIFKHNSLSINELYNTIEGGYSKEELIDSLLYNSLLENILIESPDYIYKKFKKDNFTFIQKYDIAIAKYPIEAEIHLTERCNLRCKHCCYNCTKESLYGELNKKRWIKIFEDFEDKGLFKVSISGGEPFLYPEILEILKDVSSRKFRVELLTNATLIKDEHLKYINSPNIFLNVSLDGAQKEFHEELRGINTFDKTLSNLYKLRDIKAQINISSTIFKKNIFQLENLVKEAIKIKANTINFILLDNIGRAKENIDLVLSITDKRYISKEINRLIEIYSKDININGSSDKCVVKI